jgi:DHA1 family tetracycline resistance protein-like MFS transporter
VRPARRHASLAILFVIVFIDLLGFGMVIPVLPLYAKTLGGQEAWVGLLSSGYSAMQFVFAPIWGRLSDRIGRRPVLLVSIAMTALAFALYGLAGSFAWLLVARLFAGVATANIAIAQAYVADVTTPETRAKGMGLIGAAFGLGFVLGPAFGGLLSRWSLAAPSFAAAGLAAVNLVAAWFVLGEPSQRQAAGHGARPRGLAALRTELSKPGVLALIAIYFLAIAAFSAMENTYAFLATDRYGLDTQKVFYLFAYIGVIVVVVQGGLIGPLTRRFGEKRLLVAGLLLQCAGLGALPFATGLAGLLLATAPLALGSGLTSPALSSLLSRLARADDQGGTLGLGQSAAAFGRIVGPEAGTWTYSAHGPAVPYVGGAVLMILAAAVGAALRPPSPDA